MQYAKTKKIEISKDGTHHTIEGIPLYTTQFDTVLAFHEPGLAPVKDQTGAYHILPTGEPAYTKRFIDTFGFYNNLATVKDKAGFFHIHPDGNPAYDEIYDWCGNFQHSLCVVKNKQHYFHINTEGKRIYNKNYAYAGDYREGYAVVCKDGLHTHIDRQGQQLHNQWFLDLDVFHKGYARAKDNNGWFHIDKNGNALYKNRFLNIEPYYNNLARVTTHEQNILIIDPNGDIVNTIHSNKPNLVSELSSKFVGFWTTQTLFTAVNLGILDYLPNPINVISQQSNLPKSNALRLLRALWEIGIISCENNIWKLTPEGELLSPTKTSFGASAAKTWQTINLENWPHLSELLRHKKQKRHLSIKETCDNPELLSTFHRALDGYTKNDFSDTLEYIDWKKHQHVIACERTGLSFLNLLGNKFNNLSLTVLGHKNNIVQLDKNSKVQTVEHNLTEKWPVVGDAICLTRTLHYWPDEKALEILKNAKSALSSNGFIYIFEMVLNTKSPTGSLLDLNMLAETGGALRTLPQWKKFANATNLKIAKHQELLPYLTLITMVNNNV